MSGSERWVAVSALGAAMFAVGFSFAGVACGTRDISVSEAARAAASANAVPAPAASLSNVAKVVNGAAVAPVVSPATSAPVAANDGKVAPSEVIASSDGLKLKRFVVTRKIENHEPAGADDFTLGSAPVYAFVEFENASSAERSVRVLFQNQETKATVGHVKLNVPASQGRFRTWGNTRLIRDPGHWVAIVSTVDGVELGRVPFEMKG